MVKEVEIQGYEQCVEAIEEYSLKTESFYVLFTGSKTENGESWCPDCVIVEKILEELLPLIEDEDAVLLRIDVGDKPTWKEPANNFRQDKRFLLTSIPTLMQFGKQVKRLDGEQCNDRECIKMFFDIETDEQD